MIRQAMLIRHQKPTVSPLSVGILQRKCTSCGQHKFGGGTCAKCSEKQLSTSNRTKLQTKLRISQPNDRYEQEADRIASSVLSGQYPQSFSRLENDTNIQRTEQKEENSVLEEEIGGELDSPIKLPSNRQSSPSSEEESNPTVTDVQRKPSTSGSGISAVPSKLDSSLGRELSDDVRLDMEQRFGADFSRVRVHTDVGSDALCKSFAARAFTHQNHIYFAANEYNPKSFEGKHLLAHELTHTIQQSASPVDTRQDNAPVTQQMDTSSPVIQRAIDTSVLLHTFSLSRLNGAMGAAQNGTVENTMREIENTAVNSFSSRNPVLSMHLSDQWRYYADSFNFCRTAATRSSATARLANCAFWHYVADDIYDLTFSYRHIDTRPRQGSFATSSGQTRSTQTQLTTGAKVAYSILELSASASTTQSSGTSSATTVTATNFYEHDYDVTLDYNIRYYKLSDFRMTNDFFLDMDKVAGPHQLRGSVNVGAITLYDDDNNADNLTP